MDLASDYIRLPSSEVRLEAILSLMEGAKPLSDLQEDMDRRNTTILHALTDLAEIDIVEQIDKDYRLTNIGKIESLLLKYSVEMAETLEKFNEFILKHDFSGIPSYFLLTIGKLKNAELIQTEEAHLGIVHERYIELVKESKYIRGVSPVFHPDFVDIFGNLLEKNCEIELILNENILGQLMITTDISSIMHFIESGLLKIYKGENLPIGLTVTNNIISLGFFNINGTYDYSVDLISSDPKAREWGEGLFEYYKKRAVDITEEGLVQ